MWMRVTIAVLAVAALAGGSPAVADRWPPAGGGPGRPIRLEGFWGGTRDSPGAIGDITISAKGHEKRRFAVTAVQAYFPEEEGMQIFRFTSDHPSTLIARGDAVGRLFAARAGDRITAFGTYMPGSGMFVVGSVEPVAAAKR
jgi:hypothetical protein